MEWRETLRQVLSGYFGDETLEEGVDMMVFVTEVHLPSHQEYLAAFDQGIAAAAQNDEGIVEMIHDSNASYSYVATNPAEAAQYLERLRRAYLTRYEEARESIHGKTAD